MRIGIVFLLMILPCAQVFAQTNDTQRSVDVGPWKIEASFTKEPKFDRCIMTRTTADAMNVQFTRDDGGTSLTLTSQKWQLENGKTYPVEFAAGSVTWKADVAATTNAVRIALTDKRFNNALEDANRLEVRAASSTIRIPLDKSAAALKRLESCYETNRKALETNPFVAPKP